MDGLVPSTLRDFSARVLKFIMSVACLLHLPKKEAGQKKEKKIINN